MEFGIYPTKSDDVSTFDTVRGELYLLLEKVRRSAAVKVAEDDEFNLGINCALANEEMWLTELLHKLEISC